ncbi:MAG: efflux RND transporter permease subunit, partial [Caulobacteraceae bacterium]
MTLSDLSVRRPVFAAVAAIILCVVGVAAFFALPVRELPNVDPPQVSVTTQYRGASAEVVEERITQVIERQVAGIQGIDRVQSSSRDGSSRVNITFRLDRDLEAAANDVRDAVARVQNQLPEQVEAPQIAKANADSSPVMFLNLTSKTMNRLQLSDYANRYIVERLSTTNGVAQVFLTGNQNYSMRIWLNADAMAARGVTVADVENALNAQNVELPAGQLEGAAKDYTIRVSRNYQTPEQFAQLPVTVSGGQGSASAASTTGSPVQTVTSTSSAQGAGAVAINSTYVTRLGDIARVEEGPDEPRRMFRMNGVDQIGIGLTRQSQANDLEISREVHKTLDEINATLPKGTRIDVTVDYSVFTREAIKEVWITMAMALGLVAFVNFIFLGSWRSALIPSVVAPICILSSFMVLAPLGFSINLLTLLALVLAIGLVVDDAIVVVENIQRRIDEGEPPLVAAERGAKQVFFAVVATTVVLISVFAPLMFLPGYIGRLFVELAVAIAAAVFFSALLALSLSPMLASKLLRPAKTEGWLACKVDTAMEALKNSYHNSLEMLLGVKAASMGAGLLVAVLALLAGGLFMALPKELVPAEDRGRVDVNIQGPEGAGYEYTRAAVLKAEPAVQKLIRDGVAVRYILGVPRFNQNQFNTGFGSLVLADWDKREETAPEVAAQLNKQLGRVTAARVIASVRGPFQRGGGGGSGSNVDFIASGNNYEEVARWMAPMLQAAENNPGLQRPRLDYEPNAPRLIVNLDREKA